ncbi:NTP transferase domain-containing protein [Clostridium sp. DJ247]|uniref:nucleotidyltransferase family protein n=1 Tax=Clostridium sp. DJ247 TaxID=2726188 RepID=UPI0016260528|nr:nucleotidyltransferase family protein [Clostridium sp. DJ247]MBC2580378.1 nucleotidyltransferase family protein [Clostridium sp. DJ247]
MEVEGIVLAAGFSSRAGTFKMALDFNGKTVIENCVGNMKRCCSRVYVIGGYKIEIIENILKDYEDVYVVFNENYVEGMLSSVKKGISSLRGDKFFFTPGDYPIINSETYKSLLKVQGDITIPTFQGRKGHPVLMKTVLAKELLENHSFESMKDFINSKGFKTVDVPDKGILMDIDTMEDYRKLLNL